MDGAAPLDFEVAKIARVLGKRRTDSEVVVTRRGKTITVRAARPGAAPGEAEQQPIAQFRGDGDGTYALHWSRATGGWESYGISGTLDECLEEVRRDAYGCFWGP